MFIINCYLTVHTAMISTVMPFFRHSVSSIWVQITQVHILILNLIMIELPVNISVHQYNKFFNQHPTTLWGFVSLLVTCFSKPRELETLDCSSACCNAPLVLFSFPSSHRNKHKPILSKTILGLGAYVGLPHYLMERKWLKYLCQCRLVYTVYIGLGVWVNLSLKGFVANGTVYKWLNKQKGQTAKT